MLFEYTRATCLNMYVLKIHTDYIMQNNFQMAFYYLTLTERHLSDIETPFSDLKRSAKQLVNITFIQIVQAIIPS